MHSDSTKVRQILLNLLSNASKFTERGHIALTAQAVSSEAGDMVEFQVADSGIGIAEEHLTKLFQEFTQLDTSSTRRYGGTGLGLAISQRFAQMLGGEIVARSQPGKGSTFIVRLPRRVEP